MKTITVNMSSVVAVLLYSITVVRLVNVKYYDEIKYAVIIAIFLYCSIYAKFILSKEYRLINILTLAFCIMLITSSYVGRSAIKIERDSYLASIVFCVMLIEIVACFEIFNKLNCVNRIIQILFYFTCIITVLNDVIILIPNAKTYFNGYLVGSKFSVVYLHLELLCFYLLYSAVCGIRFRKCVAIGLSVFSVAICIGVDSSTGVLCFAVFWLLFCMYSNRGRIRLVKAYIVTVVFSFSFIYYYPIVLSNPVVKFVVTNILGRDLTLTARTLIFEDVKRLMKSHYIMGYGYGTSYGIGTSQGMGFPDTQNGILEWIFQAGVINTIVLLVLIGLFLHLVEESLVNSKSKIIKSRTMPLICLILTYLVIGSIEITLGLSFMFIVCMVYSVAYCDGHMRIIYEKNSQ